MDFLELVSKYSKKVASWGAILVVISETLIFFNQKIEEKKETIKKEPEEKGQEE